MQVSINASPRAHWSNRANAIVKQLSLLCYRFKLKENKLIGCAVLGKGGGGKREKRMGYGGKTFRVFLSAKI